MSIGQEVWTLEDCINYATHHSIEIRKIDINISEAKVDTKLNEQSALPSLDAASRASLGIGRSVDPTSNDFINSNIVSTDYGLSSELNLYNGGILKNRIAQGKVQQELLEASRDVQISNLVIDLTKAYFDALLTKDYYTNVEAQLHSINEQIKYLQRLVTEGSRAPYELIELQAEQANIERQLLYAEHAIIESMLYVKSFLNLETEKEIELASPAEHLYDSILESLTIEMLADRALKNMPELNVHRLIKRHGEIDMKIAEGLKKPIVSLQGRISTSFSNKANRIAGTTSVLTESSVFLDGNRTTLGEVREIPGSFETIPYANQLNSNLSVGLSVQVRIPIFDNYKSQGAKEKALLQLETIKVEKEQFVNDITYELSQYLNSAREAYKNLKATEKLLSVRKLATENTTKRFELGAISSYDFIDLQEKLNVSEIEYIIAKYEYMKIMQILDFYQGNG